MKWPMVKRSTMMSELKKLKDKQDIRNSNLIDSQEWEIEKLKGKIGDLGTLIDMERADMKGLHDVISAQEEVIKRKNDELYGRETKIIALRKLISEQ